MGNFKDGNRLLGRYILQKECGTEQEDEPMKKRENNHENEIF